MAFQNIAFKNTNISGNSTREELLRQKIASLQKYIPEGVPARVEVEFEKITTHKSGQDCRVEINVWVSSTLYRAESSQSNFEAAIDVVKDDLDQDLRKAHKKRNSLFRRGSRKIKELVRWG
jgi:ribosomal subunit interface protein